jgi:hypothetical protein
MMRESYPTISSSRTWKRKYVASSSAERSTFTGVRCTIFEAVKKDFIERQPVIVLLIDDVAESSYGF